MARRSLTCRFSGISPISSRKSVPPSAHWKRPRFADWALVKAPLTWPKSSLSKRRSEEHTSELQSRLHLVCRLLLEKRKSWKDWKPIGKATEQKRRSNHNEARSH